MAAACTALDLPWHGPGLVGTHTAVNSLPVGFRFAHYFLPSPFSHNSEVVASGRKEPYPNYTYKPEERHMD